jgi:hypothetical protein
MASKIEEVAYKIKSYDESGDGLRSAGDRLERFVRESTHTARELRHLSEGAGIGLVVGETVSRITEIGEKMAEYDKQQREILETSRSEAEMQMRLNRAWGESIPVIGGAVAALNKWDDASKDLAASQALEAGATAEQYRWMLSYGSQLKYVTDLSKAAKEAIDLQAEAMKAQQEVMAQAAGGAGKEDTDAQAAVNAAVDRAAKIKEAVSAWIQAHPHRTDEEFRENAEEPTRAANEIIRAGFEKAELIRREYAQRSQDQRGKTYQDEERAEFEAQQKRFDVAAHAEAARLQIEKRDADASLVELKRSHERELAESVRAEQDRVRQIQDQANAAQGQGLNVDWRTVKDEQMAEHRRAIAERDAENEKFIADQAKVRQDEANRVQDEAEQRRQSLLETRMDLMKEAAGLGDREARVQSEILEIETRRNAQIEKINKDLREHAAQMTDEQKRQARDQMSAIEQAKQAEEQFAKDRFAQGQVGSPSSPFAQSDEVHGTGAREAFAASVKMGEQAQRDKQVEHNRQMISALEKILEKVGPITTAVGGMGAANLKGY